MHAKLRERCGGEVGEVNISPLIDMVFILLIFFIVTTVFVDEDEREVSLGALGQELRLLRGEGEASVTLVMEASVLVTASVAVMDECSRAGFTRIVLKELAR